MIATVEDMRKIRSIAVNVSPEMLIPYIDDAEKQDIIEVLTPSLYFAIEGDRSNPKYKILLEGGVYNDCNCEKYNRGLLKAIAYLAYARLLIFGDIQATAFGIKKKNTNYSENVGEVDKARASSSARKIGLDILRDCKIIADQLRMSGDCCSTDTVERRQRYIKIGNSKL